MWNERYSQPGFAYGTKPNDFLASVAGRIPRGRVLAMGDGEGRNGVFLAGLGCDVTSVDSSDVGLAKARALAAERGVSIATVHADLRDFRIEPESWDAVVSIFCHLPPGIRKPLHRAVVAGLKPGGCFVLEAYTPAQLGRGTGGPQTVEMLVSLELLRHELNGLNFVVAEECERDVREGSFHTGAASVVQVLATKP